MKVNRCIRAVFFEMGRVDRMSTFAVDPENKNPIYYQVYTHLKERILSGAYRLGDTLPSESEMIEAFGVSRITVRRAIADLEHDGLVQKRRGKGTVVLPRKVASDLSSLYSFSESATQQGDRLSYAVLESGIRVAGGRVGKALGISADCKVYELYRLVLLNGKVAGVTHAYVPARQEWSEMLRSYDGYTSLFACFREHGVLIDYAEESIEVTFPSSEVRRVLSLGTGDPVIYTKHLTYGIAGDVICYTDTYTKHDKFKYTVTIK